MITRPKLFVFNVFAFTAAILFLSSCAMASVEFNDLFFDSPDVVDFSEAPPFTPGVPFASATVGNATFLSPGPPTLLVISVGDAILLEVATGTIRVDFVTDVNRIGFDYDTSSELFIEAFDAFDNPLSPNTAQVTTSGPGFVGVESLATGIAYVIFHDNGNQFQVTTFRSEAVAAAAIPEPISFVIWSLLGLTATGTCWWRRRRKV